MNPHEYEGLDFMCLMQHMLAHPLFDGMDKIDLSLQRGERDQFRFRGRIYGGWARHEENLVVLNVWPGVRRMSVLSTLLHELVHLRLGPGVGHRSLFRRTYREAARQVYGIRVPWTSCENMGRYVQWCLAEMANRSFWESIEDARAGRWDPPVPAWWGSILP